jgi:biopolymer transport protein ExbD
MMRRPQRKPVMSDDRILPLINVVFMLLIFFMLAGRFSATDPFEIDPAKSTSEAQGALEEIVVLIGADGRLALGGEVISEQVLSRRISAAVAEDAPVVRLKADGRAEAGRVIAVMELIRDAGAGELKLLTLARGS